MKRVNMKYGNTTIDVSIRMDNLLGVIESNKTCSHKTEEEVVIDALKNPIGSNPLGEIVQKGEKICIVISDITRAWQKMNFYLAFIVDELNEAGIEDRDIIFLCATGSHRKQTKEEHRILLGEKLAQRFEVIDHNALDQEQLVFLGKTSFGTPVRLNKLAVEADHVLLTGAIVFHDLAGFGGGRKSILPGIACYESIMANHALALNEKVGGGSNPSVRCGNVKTNPIHLDMIEATNFLKPSFLFNVIIDGDGHIIKAVAGGYIKAHEMGQKMVEQMDGVSIKEKADLVIASAGGYPKDINLYQATKTLSNAKEAVKNGGNIIILSECIEGVGNEDVRQIIEDYENNVERECAVREEFSVAKYIGYDMAQTAKRFQIIFVSDLDPDLMKKIHIQVVKTVEEALTRVYKEKGENLKAYFIPYGANTLPKYKQ
ncbi:lactate racemase domain-containing protein [Marinisporobacter balticus]|uniref:Nickel-dependent lactate racemase n=1 Tax=Marinisporobacter balticus TaxID=2018667 RepID=A0A4R2KTZ5_9FIRM|nr:nickel-dependent lactate racemase [Marinisporobacter balticus]TCO74586.1 nickel-dependent lactate racemase [Marinisporobacter balticus]